MASSHSKHKPKLQPISLAELEADSTMVGFTSLFRIPTTEPALPHLAPPPVELTSPTVVSPSEPTVGDTCIDTVGDQLTPTVAVLSSTVGDGRKNSRKLEKRKDISPQPTVGDSGTDSTAPRGVTLTPTVGDRLSKPKDLRLFQSEDGSLFPAKRARRIQLAQDALTHVEETVYDILWGSKTSSGDRSRAIRIGYDRLAALARINEKSVRNIIPRLIQKGFISILTPADPNRRLGTEYRVLSYSAVLEDQQQRGRHWIVRTGKGVFYAQPATASVTTVGFDTSPTVGEILSHTVGDTPTVAATPTDTVGPAPTDTVGVAPTVSIDNRLGTERQTSSAILAALNTHGRGDDDAVHSLIRRCRRYAPDATEAEIVHFIHEKASVLKSGRIDNPIAFLLVYVPKCFAGETLRQYRDEQRRRQAEARQAERDAEAWDLAERERLKTVLDDPSASAEEKAWARQYLAS
jgi:predicted transcriptional regulator